MRNNLHLIWNNPSAAPHASVSASTLRQLSEVLIGCVRRNEWQAARQLVSLYAPSPFGIAVIAGQMSRAGIAEESVLKIV